ncbi:MAG: hypothetical protein DRP62_04975 [Planctomycetota bacterium]|nr:MAG: hypothetical protein DRP62_04975 [Planctomycetota bacterium]
MVLNDFRWHKHWDAKRNLNISPQLYVGGFNHQDKPFDFAQGRPGGFRLGVKTPGLNSVDSCKISQNSVS